MVESKPNTHDTQMKALIHVNLLLQLQNWLVMEQASNGPIKMMTDEVCMMNEVMVIFDWKKNQKRNNLFSSLQNVW